MEMPLKKYLGFNFHTWKVNIQVLLMNKNIRAIVKGMKPTPKDPNQLLEWHSKDDKEKTIIGLAFLDSELHHVDMYKSMLSEPDRSSNRRSPKCEPDRNRQKSG